MKLLVRNEKKNVPQRSQMKKSNIKSKVFWIIIILSAALFAAYLYWDNNTVQTTSLIVCDEKIPAGFDGFKIAQISDLHSKCFGENQSMITVALKEFSPDIIVVTGDLIDGYDPVPENSMALINEALKIAPVYYVTGNHEKYVKMEYEDIRRRIIESGGVVLEDESLELERNGDFINLAGINDESFFMYRKKGEPSFKDVLKKLNREDIYTILLSHRPEFFDTYCEIGFDLVISGHAHGGQFILPFIGPLYAPNQGFFPKYTEGIYENGDTKMVVSRGLGNSTIRLRINNQPELVQITLKKQK